MDRYFAESDPAAFVTDYAGTDGPCKRLGGETGIKFAPESRPVRLCSQVPSCTVAKSTV